MPISLPDQDVIERFWRHLLAGAASLRFHRPNSGLGINDKAVACIRAARKLETKIPLWNVEPAGQLLSEREENEAYVAASPQRDTLVLYFPARKEAGKIGLDLRKTKEMFTLQWINIDTGELGESATIQGGEEANISSPGKASFAAAIMLKEKYCSSTATVATILSCSSVTP